MWINVNVKKSLWIFLRKENELGRGECKGDRMVIDGKSKLVRWK